MIGAVVLAGAAADGRAQDAPSEPAPVDAEADSSDASQQTKASCVESFRALQKLRREGKLVAARAHALSCAQSSCPDVITPVCTQWLAELNRAVPSVVITAKSPTGVDLVDVRVSIDGEPVATRLDGRPLPLDPGPHAFRFERSGDPPVEQQVVAVEGQQNRVISIVIGKPPPSTPPRVPDRTEPPGLSPWVYVGFGLGAAGLVAGTITGIVTLNNAATLEQECPNNVCPPERHDDLDANYTLAHVSTVSFALAGVGVTVGIVAVLLSSAEPDDTQTGSASVWPLVGLGTIGIGGSF